MVHGIGFRLIKKDTLFIRINPWKDSATKPSVHHVVLRVVDRRFAFGPEEKEKFRMFMRMAENFTACRVLTYSVMSNHLHILLEVPPMPEEGLSDEVLFERIRTLYSKGRVEAVAGGKNPRGALAELAGTVRSARDLRSGVGCP